MTSSPRKQSLKIACPHCGAAFAVAPKADVAGELEIPCPSCWMVVQVPADAERQDVRELPSGSWQRGRAIVHAKGPAPRAARREPDGQDTMELPVNPRTTMPISSGDNSYPVTVSVDVTIINPGQVNRSAESQVHPELRPLPASLDVYSRDEPTEEARMPFFRDTMNMARPEGAPQRIRRPVSEEFENLFAAPDDPPLASSEGRKSKAKLKAVLRKIKTSLEDSSVSDAIVRQAEPQPVAATAPPAAEVTEPAEGNEANAESKHGSLRARLQALRTGGYTALTRPGQEPERAEEPKPQQSQTPVVAPNTPVTPDPATVRGEVPAELLEVAGQVEEEVALPVAVPKATGMLHRVDTAPSAPHNELRQMLAKVKLKSKVVGSVGIVENPNPSPTASAGRQGGTLIGMPAAARPSPDLPRRTEPQETLMGLPVGADSSPEVPVPDEVEEPTLVPSTTSSTWPTPEKMRGLTVKGAEPAAAGEDPDATVELTATASGEGWQEVPLAESGLWDTQDLKHQIEVETAQQKRAEPAPPEPVEMEPLAAPTVGEVVVEPRSSPAPERRREDSVQVKLSALEPQPAPDTGVVATAEDDDADLLPEVEPVAPTSLPAAHQESEKGWVRRLGNVLTVVAVLAVIAVLGLGAESFGYGLFGYKEWLVPLAGGQMAHIGPAASKQYKEKRQTITVHQTQTRATAAVHRAVGPPADEGPGIVRLARNLAAQNHNNRARRLLEESLDRGIITGDITAEAVNLLLKENRPRRARELAWMAIESRGREPAYMEALARSFDADPKFAPPAPRALEIGEDVRTIRSAAMSPDVLELVPKTGDKGLFIPERSDQPNLDDLQLRAWRLCEFLRCSVSIPYGERTTVVGEAPAEMVPRFVGWREHIVVDKGSMHGVWFPGQDLDGEPLPIELADAWMPWMKQDATTTLGRSPAVSALGELGAGGRANRLAKPLEGKTVDWLAQHVATLVVLDYLLGSDHLAEDERNYGKGVLLTSEGLVVAHFGRRAEVDERYASWIMAMERFPSRLIVSLRALERDNAGRWFFAGRDGKVQEEALDEFWSRRDLLLARIAELTSEHRETNVLSLE